MEKKNNLKDDIRNVIGGFFIFIGFVGIFSSGVLAGILIMLFGISLLPIFYEKMKLKKIRYIQFLLPIIIIFLIGAVPTPTTNQTTNNLNTIESNSTVAVEEKHIEITKMQFNETLVEMDIKETKKLTMEIAPNEAEIEELEYCNSNSQIANLEKNDTESKDNILVLNITPITEGNCEFYIKSKNGIESNKVSIKIIDNERIEREKQEAEERERQEAEEKAKKEAEEKAAEEAKQKAQQTSKTTTSTKQQTSTTTKSNSDTSRTVYITPTGKKYHYSSTCGGENSYSITLNSAKSRGYTPCKKCAQ